jgi:hypothetical protein
MRLGSQCIHQSDYSDRKCCSGFQVLNGETWVVAPFGNYLSMRSIKSKSLQLFARKTGCDLSRQARMVN